MQDIKMTSRGESSRGRSGSRTPSVRGRRGRGRGGRSSSSTVSNTGPLLPMPSWEGGQELNQNSPSVQNRTQQQNSPPLTSQQLPTPGQVPPPPPTVPSPAVPSPPPTAEAGPEASHNPLDEPSINDGSEASNGSSNFLTRYLYST